MTTSTYEFRTPQGKLVDTVEAADDNAAVSIAIKADYRHKVIVQQHTRDEVTVLPDPACRTPFATDRPWEPSKRCQEAIAQMWDAFYDGDRWLRAQHQSTVRMTVGSLVKNGMADVDPDDGYRFRISEAALNDNGMTRTVRFFAGATLNDLNEIIDAIDADLEEAA